MVGRDEAVDSIRNGGLCSPMYPGHARWPSLGFGAEAAPSYEAPIKTLPPLQRWRLQRFCLCGCCYDTTAAASLERIASAIVGGQLKYRPGA